jgi:plasmid stability protein
MSTSLTIPNLDEPVRLRLRAQASKHGRSLEDEALDLLTFAVTIKEQETVPTSAAPLASNICDAVRGIWKGRSTTAEMMRELRGEE